MKRLPSPRPGTRALRWPRCSRAAICLLALSAGCSEGKVAAEEGAEKRQEDPAPPPLLIEEAPGVVHLIDRFRDVTEVSGAVRDFALFYRFENVPLAVEPYRAGLAVARLPWPASAGSLAVTAGGRQLPQRSSPRQAAEEGGFFWLPQHQRFDAAVLHHVQGTVQREVFAPRHVPAHLLLEKDGDFLSFDVELADSWGTLSLLGRGTNRNRARLGVLVDDREIGEVVLRNRAWTVETLTFEVEPGHHRVRMTATFELDPDKKEPAAVGVVWVNLQSASEVVLVSEEAVEVTGSYLARTPEPTCLLDYDFDRYVSFLSVGNDVLITPEGGKVKRIRLGADAVDADGFQDGAAVFEDVPPGLQTLRITGAPRSVRVEQPAAALIPQVLDPTLRLRDYPFESGERTGSGVSSEILDRVLSRMVTRFDRRTGFWLPAPSRLEIAMDLRAGDHLAFSPGIPVTPPQEAGEGLLRRPPRSVPATAPVTFRVWWTPEGAAMPVLLDECTLAAEDTGWIDREARIAPELAGAGVLRFETLVDGPRITVAGFADPRVRRAGGGPPGGPNLLVYVIDTLRADHLSCYGGERPTSPNLDALARDGFLFRNCQAVTSWTRPSTASILTGLYPSWHGANAGKALPDSLVTLAEVMRVQGYSTWAAASNVQVAARHVRFDQGFHRFVHKDGMVAPDDRAQEDWTSWRINETVLPWLESHGHEPFFLYLHSLDPHSPYQSHASANLPFARDYDGILKDVPLAPRSELRPLTDRLGEEDIEYVKEMYDNEIVHQDREFGRLMDGLAALGLREDTIVLVVSDHGEEFAEHGDWDHAGRMWQELVRVPCILWLPESLRRRWDLTPRVVEVPISQVDLVPGLLELLEIPDPYPRQGKSLLAGLRGEGEPGAVYSEEVVEDGDDLGSILWGSYKMIWRRDDHGVVQFLLFDLSRDPGEQDDLAADQPAILRQLQQLRDRVRAEFVELNVRLEAAGFPPLTGGEKVELDADTLRQLEALGYVGDEDR